MTAALAHPPVTTPETRRVTPEEFLEMDNRGLELIDGQIVEKNVSFASARVEITAGAVLYRAAEGHDCSVCAATLNYRCFPEDPARFRKPDVSVIRNGRLRDLGNLNPGEMPIPPDLAVEVVSDNDGFNDVWGKAEEYLAAGFPLVWVLDPKHRKALVFTAGREKPDVLAADDTIDAGDLLPGWSCKVADLFGTPVAKNAE